MEDVYDIPPENVFHVHGTVDDEEVITGFNCIINPENYNAPTDEEECVEREYLKALNKLDKDINGQWQKNSIVLSSLADMTRVVVLGHSLGQIDSRYLYMIADAVSSDAHWHFSKYTEKDEENINIFLETCKKDLKKNQMIRWIFNF